MQIICYIKKGSSTERGHGRTKLQIVRVVECNVKLEETGRCKVSSK